MQVPYCLVRCTPKAYARAVGVRHCLAWGSLSSDLPAGLLFRLLLICLVFQHYNCARETPEGTFPHLQWPGPHEQCSSEHLSLEGVELGPNVIMGMAHGYDMEQLHLLVSSFTRHMKRATLVLFGKTVPDRWPRHLEDVHFMTVEFEASTGGPTEIRHFAYRCLLQAAPSVRRVVTVDTRDVVFIGDPFEVYTDNVMHFFQESSLKPIGQEQYNREWVLTCTAELNLPLAADNLMGLPVLNGGTMIGPARFLQQFLETLTAIMTSSERCGDQGLLNVLLWSGQYKLPPFQMETTEVGRWLTVGLKEARDSTYLIQGSDLTSKATGKPYVAAHQYDRVPELVAHFHSMYPKEHEHEHPTV